MLAPFRAHRRSIVIAAVIVSIASLYALSYNGASRRTITAIASGPTPTITDTALPDMTAPAITPTAPITPTLYSDLYPTTTAYAMASVNFAKTIAFEPDGFDIAFTANKVYQKGVQDLFRASADEDGDLTGEVSNITGLYDNVGGIDKVISNNDSDLLALGVFDDDGSHLGWYDYSDVWLIAPDGTSARNLTHGDLQIVNFWWVPTGDEVAMLTTAGDLVARNITTETDDVVATGLTVPGGDAGAVVAWSSDGSLVALGTSDPNDLSDRLELVNRTTDARVVLHDFGSSGYLLPVFSSGDSSVYVFVGDEQSGTYTTDLYDVSVLGSVQYLATVSSTSSEPTWVTSAVLDADSGRLFYIVGKQIYRVDQDGTNNTAVVTNHTVRGELQIQILGSSHKRLAYIASTFHGFMNFAPITTPTPTTQYASTTFNIYSIDITD